MLAGTNGEAVTLNAEEKKKLIHLTREIAVQTGRPDLPITIGCGGQSTHQVIVETHEASKAGADFVLVLVPSYFHFAMNEEAIVSFFQEVWQAFLCSLLASSFLSPLRFFIRLTYLFISLRMPVLSLSLSTTSLGSLLD